MRWIVPVGLVLALGFSALAAAPLSVIQGETGNVCVRDFQPGAVCTANDVRIEQLIVVSVVEDCNSGVVGETEVVFQALVSAAGSPDRFDIGLFLALDGGSARDGDSCFHDFLSPPLTSTPTLGDSNMDGVMDIEGGPWLDNDSDSCGDIGTNTQVLTTLAPLRFACIDNNGDGSADVGVCTSWDNNANTVCNDVSGAFPGTNSKCSCDSVELGIALGPQITVVTTPANQMVAPGGTASFTFTVTSPTTVSNVVLSHNPMCDTLSGPAGDINSDTILTPDETWTYTCDVNNVLSSFTGTVTATGDGPSGPVQDTDTADVSVVENPVIGVAKQVTSVTDAGGGQFDAAFELLVENLGNVTLSNVQVTDDLTATFPAPVAFAIQAGPAAGGTLTANGGFNGAGDTNLLNAAASTLAAGATATITFTVRFDPNGASGPFNNSALASGDSPLATTVTDTSDDGTDPDPNGNGDPDEAGENDSTPVAITENPVIGVAKLLTSLNDAGGGQFDAAFQMTVENLGDVFLSNIQVTDDLSSTFPAPVTFAIQAGPVATGSLSANAGFNGAGDPQLLSAAGSTLAAGAVETITFTVRFNPNGAPGPFSNSALVNGDSPVGTMVTDTSDDGTDPDPDGQGDPDEPGENDPTPITLPQPEPPTPPAVEEIPTLSQWGTMILAFLLAAAASGIIRRRQVR